MAIEPRYVDTPLTDPRSLFSSLGVHALLLFLASLVVLSAVAPEHTRESDALQAVIEPVDNRVMEGDGGGGPGDLGGLGTTLQLDARPEVEGRTDAAGNVESANAEAVAATPDQSAGVLPGPGRGGGGGSGGGSGGGHGQGTGVSTEFFGIKESAKSFVYVIDRSGSMTQHGAFELAKSELLASLGRLAPDVRFGVIFYNLEAVSIGGSGVVDALAPATPENLARVQARLAGLKSTGGTDHVRALRYAFAIGAEVVYFLTDARQMTPEDVDTLKAEAGDCRVQAVMFGVGADPSTDDPLQRLAVATGGSYRYVDVIRARAATH